MPHAPSPPLLEVTNLNVSFQTREGTFHAVKDLSFSLKEGESLALVGESGSGKSVSMRAVLGLLDKKSVGSIRGDAWFDIGAGRSERLNEPKNLKSIRGKEIGMIFQEPMTALNPMMRCGKQIMEVVSTHLEL